jgi:transcriptional regulator with XRE-family HTH domain
MSLSKIIGARLKSERDRLRISQSHISELAKRHEVPGASQNQISLWELGKKSVNVEFLSVLAGVGFDVNFVLTGERKTGITKAALYHVLVMAKNPNPAMTEEQQSVSALMGTAEMLSDNFVVSQETPDGDVLYSAEPKRRGRPPKA